MRHIYNAQYFKLCQNDLLPDSVYENIICFRVFQSLISLGEEKKRRCLLNRLKKTLEAKLKPGL